MSVNVAGSLSGVEQAVALNIQGLAGVAVQIAGTWAGTIQFECNVGHGYVALNCTPPSSSTAVQNTTANGVWQAPVAGLRSVRVRASAWTSGTAIISWQGAEGSPVPGSAAGGGATTISDGSDVAEGSTTDAAVTGDNAGTVSAKLRGLNKLFADVWDSVNHYLKVSIQNTSLATTTLAATTETLSNVASSASNVQLLAATASRRAATIFNDSTAALYVKFGVTASTSSFTVKIAAGGYYEFPLPIYTGQVDGIWDAANGNARLTEGT